MDNTSLNIAVQGPEVWPTPYALLKNSLGDSEESIDFKED
jgi:hypothetical protein